MDSSSEAECLLRRCQEGDELALGELVRLYQDRVLQFALRASGDPSLAEEATVDCFYRVWMKCRQQRHGASAEAWIFRIAHRALLDLARSRQRWWKRMFSGSKKEVDPQPGPLETMIQSEHLGLLTQELESALDSLADRDRALVHLYYFEGQSLAEIAVVLEVSRETLKMRLMRARQRLKKILELADGD